MSARTVAAFVAKALVAGLFVFFVLPLLELLPEPLALVMAVVGWILLTLAPWSPCLRGEWLRGRQLRETRRARVLLALLLTVAGAGLCVSSDYWFGTHNGLGRQVIGVRWDLALSAPFALLGLLVLLTGMSAAGALIAGAALGFVCAGSYEAVTSSASSTAAIGYIYPWLLGVPLVIVCYVIDAGARGYTTWRDWRRDTRRL